MGEPRTRGELEIAIDELLREAYANGVVVDNGGYGLRHEDSDIPDWEVHITRTAKPEWDT